MGNRIFFDGLGDETFTSSGTTCQWPLISRESLMRARFDLEFGVVRPASMPLKIDMDSVSIQMPVSSAARLLEIPIDISDMCVSEITNIKRWKRRGQRPDKVRMRSQTVPGMLVFDDPITQQKRIVCHPDVFKKIKRMEGICYGTNEDTMDR